MCDPRSSLSRAAVAEAESTLASQHGHEHRLRTVTLGAKEGHVLVSPRVASWHVCAWHLWRTASTCVTKREMRWRHAVADRDVALLRGLLQCPHVCCSCVARPLCSVADYLHERARETWSGMHCVCWYTVACVMTRRQYVRDSHRVSKPQQRHRGRNLRRWRCPMRGAACTTYHNSQSMCRAAYVAARTAERGRTLDRQY